MICSQVVVPYNLNGLHVPGQSILFKTRNNRDIKARSGSVDESRSEGYCVRTIGPMPKLFKLN